MKTTKEILRENELLKAKISLMYGEIYRYQRVIFALMAREKKNGL